MVGSPFPAISPCISGRYVFTSLFPFCPPFNSRPGKAWLRERSWCVGSCRLATFSLQKPRKGFHLRVPRDNGLPSLVAIKVQARTPVGQLLAGFFTDPLPCCFFPCAKSPVPAHQKVIATSNRVLSAPFLAFSLPHQSLQSPIFTAGGLTNLSFTES